jgi:hypothetical protein
MLGVMVPLSYPPGGAEEPTTSATMAGSGDVPRKGRERVVVGGVRAAPGLRCNWGKFIRIPLSARPMMAKAGPVIDEVGARDVLAIELNGDRAYPW